MPARDIYADAVAPFLAEMQALRPEGSLLYDAHTHLGLDEDGRSLELARLLAMLDDAGVERASVFPLHDPERKPSYRLPNDRVLAWAAESEGRLAPFCRLDPFEEPLAEGERCLAAGARGIKLHPRAQAFTFDAHGLGEALEGIFALAEQAGVPILIHAGRGLPPVADGLVELALRHPQVVLILAHGGICDQGVLTTGLADHPGVLYDTSCFHPIDVLALLARVPAERVVFGSDPPYGRPSGGLYLALRAAHYAGLDEAATRLLAGETMAAVIDGEGLTAAQPPRGAETIETSTRLARVYAYAALAVPALFGGILDRALESLDLAIAACRDPRPGGDAEALEVIGCALAAARRLIGDEEDRGRLYAIELVHRSMVRAVTDRAGASAGQATERPILRSDGAGAPAA